MAYIFNTTFIISPAEEENFLSEMRSAYLPQLFNAESPARNAALRKVVEAGGERPDPQHGLSMALHAEFETSDDAHRWNDIFLLPVLGEFQKKFGPDCAFFTTLLEDVLL